MLRSPRRRHRRRSGGVLAAVTAVVLVAGLTVGAPRTPAGAVADPGCTDLFPASFTADLQRRYPGIRVTAAVRDTRTGCWSQLNPGLSITTASVVKAQVLGAVLLRAQDQGRGLSAFERSNATAMISYSANPETTALYQHIGSTSGMRASDARLGASQTQHTATYGLTRSTAADRTRVAERLLHRGGGLAAAGRKEAWRFMSNVHPLQQWGITAGVPAGWSVALKNGFYPASGLGWRVGSSGFVRRDDADQGYAITVMTEGAATQATGIALTEEVSRRAASGLTVGPGRARAVDRARCVQASSGESWTGLAGRLGLSSSAAGTIKLLAGGNTSPLGGQRVCSPAIPAEPATDSAVSGTYAPVVADLDCDGRDDILWYGAGDRPDSIWRGGPTRRFTIASTNVGGPYVPVAGDFDGDGCGDVLWYASGRAADYVWYGGRGRVDSRAIGIDTEGWAPVAGDFDGDGRDDVLWYGPGSMPDRITYGSAERGRFPAVAVIANGSFQPVVGDLDGDGTDDVLWSDEPADEDPIWWGIPGRRGSYRSGRVFFGGRYRPFTVDADTDVADEIVWYAPGRVSDRLWNGPPPAHVSTIWNLDGDHLPATGDFDGDGHDDVAWHGPGGLSDRIWWGSPTGAFLSASLRPG